MKVSLNTIKQYVDVDVTIDELVAKINHQLGKVEELIDLGERYKDALVVKVISCKKHENADKLNVCLVDDDGKASDIQRDENGLVQVVCGASNVRAGMHAVWLPPQSVVPSSYEDKEPFMLDARELRGVMSYGMLASAKELALGDDHDGIVEITETDVAEGKTITAGQSFASLMDLDDTIIDIENKMFTHRPDLFGQIGVARELFAILQPVAEADKPTDIRFQEQDWYWDGVPFADATGLDLRVFNDAPEKSSRFMAVAMDGVSVGQSPLWLRATLVRWGSKPINNVVDLTNYIMLLTAQPTHAYDYDRLRGRTLGVRMANDGETVKLLNGKNYKLNTDDIIIADADGPVGLAGVMGGSDSEVSSKTTRIVLEVATFDMYAVRKSSMRHGVFTDALTRFNKGQSPLQNDRVMGKLMDLMQTHASATQASGVQDVPVLTEPFDRSTVHGEMEIEVDFINQRLGLDLSGHQIGNILRFANFAVYVGSKPSTLMITAPFFRTDIELPEDIVEEVGRLYGFDKLPKELPSRSISPARASTARHAKSLIRKTLSRHGANEVLTYSFVHEKTIKRAEQDVSQAFKLSNALSPELQYYRLTVLPSLLDKVRVNIKAGHDEFVLYEIGKGHNKQEHATDDDGLPSELEFVDMVYAAKRDANGAPFYMIRQYVEKLAAAFGKEIVCIPITEDLTYTVTSSFDLTRSAMVHVADTNEFIGLIGEFKQSVLQSFKLPAASAGATLDFAAFETFAAQSATTYRPLSKFPSISQDVSLGVEDDVLYEDVYTTSKQAVRQKAGDAFAWSLLPVTIYKPKASTEKVISLRLQISAYDSTLTDTEVSTFIQAIVDATGEAHGASLR